MRRLLLIFGVAAILAVFLTTPRVRAQSGPPFIPLGEGWHDLGVATQLQVSAGVNESPALCSADNAFGTSYGFTSNCATAWYAWNSAGLDDADEQMLIMGGGHTDYAGNDVWALKYGQATPALVHAVLPTAPVSTSNLAYIPDTGTASINCLSTTSLGGTTICPNSRHTYDGIEFIPSTHQLMLEAGAIYQSGQRAIDNWVLNVSNLTWTRVDTCGNGIVGNSCGGQTRPGSAGETVDLSSMAYDPTSGNVFYFNLFNNDFWKVNPSTDTWTKLVSGLLPAGYAEYVVSAIDPVHNQMILLNAQTSGQIIDSVNLSNNVVTDETSHCASSASLLGHGTAPAITWDSHLGEFIVIPSGLGSTVYMLNPVTFACLPLTFSIAAGNSAINGPPDPTNGGAISSLILGKRASYSTKEDAIIISGGPFQHAYALRLNATAALADFNARCTASGVQLCQNFDTSASFQHDVNVFHNGTYTSVYPAMDCSVGRSGCSMRIDVPPFQGADSGRFQSTYPGFTGANGEDFYFQVATMISPEMLSDYVNFSWPTWKNHGFFNGPTSCTGLMVVTGLNSDGLIPFGTTGGCSSNAFWTNGGTPPYLMQQGDYNCPYRGETPTLCFYWPSNTWVTFYYHLKLGTWNGTLYNNTTAEGYIAVNGQPYKQFINFQADYPFEGNGIGQGFDNVELYPYMTGKDASQGGYPTAHAWWDELIISKSPIAVPSVPPASQTVGVNIPGAATALFATSH